ncbi:MAG: pyridoxamine 5'-phosphate oxidase [Gemmatimonadaceae bacterium]
MTQRKERRAPLAEPSKRFLGLLEQATAISRERLPEPTAFALATSMDGKPSVRMLLLKHADERGFVFYTNYESRKGRELLGNPNAAMCFHWQPLEIQVRVEGPVAPVEGAEADAYFASRGRGSQIGAWASQQSRTIADEQELERRVAEFEQRFEGVIVPRPPYWSGFRLTPERIEFWKGMPSRLHRRELYVRRADSWSVEVLFP